MYGQPAIAEQFNTDHCIVFPIEEIYHLVMSKMHTYFLSKAFPLLCRGLPTLAMDIDAIASKHSL
jgi:hypothetical protein